MEHNFTSMSLETALERILPVELPEFWVGDVVDLPAKLSLLKEGEVETIAISPGGRSMHLVSYGEPEEVSGEANFNSAIGGRKPSAYLDKEARVKPVVLFVGPVHGHEVENLTGLMNLIEIMETGRDLRGRDQTRLRELGNQCRLLIIPSANPDGTARFEPRSTARLETIEDNAFWAMGTWADDRIMFWPESKQQHPSVEGFVGCYFNDAGVNPMHDEFFAPMSSEAPAVLAVAREEGPDLAVSLHSFSSAPALLRSAYVPLEIQEEVKSLAERCYALFESRNLKHGGVPQPVPESGENPAPFNLTSALYHVSGATSFTFECPHSYANDPQAFQVSMEEILDIQLALYEAMLRHAIEAKRKV